MFKKQRRGFRKDKNLATKTTTFRYITNLTIDNYNIQEIVKLGGNRWKIKNKGFYTQKHRTFNISHLNSRNDNCMKVHYLFNLLILLDNY